MEKKRKFNLVDFLIILIIGAVLVMGVFKYRKIKKEDILTGDKVKLEISYSVDELPDYIIDPIKIGDKVNSKIQNTSLGEVKDIKKGKSRTWARNSKEDIVEVSRQGYSSLELKLEAEGLASDSEYLIDKTEYCIGESLEVYVGKTFIRPGRISNIRVVE